MNLIMHPQISGGHCLEQLPKEQYQHFIHTTSSISSTYFFMGIPPPKWNLEFLFVFSAYQMTYDAKVYTMHILLKRVWTPLKHCLANTATANKSLQLYNPRTGPTFASGQWHAFCRPVGSTLHSWPVGSTLHTDQLAAHYIADQLAAHYILTSWQYIT